MKILITTDWYKPAVNGVVTSAVNLAEGLGALGHEVRILTLSGSSRSYTGGGVTYLGSADAGMIYPGARLRTALPRKYIRELAEWQPDIVHSQCEFGTFLPAKIISKAAGAPLVHTYHTVYEDFTHYFSPNIRIGKFMAAAFSRRVLASVQLVIAPTEKIKTMLRSYGVHTPVTVIPSGLSAQCFGPMLPAADRHAAREALGFADTDFVLVSLGRLAKEKNIAELLTLLSRQSAPGLRLLLAGDGPYRAQIEGRVRELKLCGRVVFTGMVSPEDAAKYYRLGDAFISASQSETQGLTYIEAMAAGLPLLCRYDPCLDGVIKSGVNGFTYQNAAEFSRLLACLLTDKALCRSLGNAARETVLQNYSAEVFAGNAVGVYQTLLP